MTETFFAGSELPIELIHKGDKWIVRALWNDGKHGEECAYDQRPNKWVRKMVRDMFIHDKQAWENHNNTQIKEHNGRL